MTLDAELRDATLARLHLLNEHVGAAVASMQGESTGPWSLRGLYISDDDATRIAESGPEAVDAALGPPDPVLVEWGRHLGIDPVDVDILIVAAAPDIDRRYEQLFGYLHDDITRRRATVGLALRLAGHEVSDPYARRRLLPEAPLASLALVELEEPDRPFLTRSLRVPDRVAMAMLGDDRPVPTVSLVRSADVVNEWVRRLAGTFDRSRPLLVHVRDRPERTAAALAAAALVESYGEAVHIRLQPGRTSWPAVLDDAVREAVLRGCGLVVEAVDDVVSTEPRMIERLAALPRPVVLTGRLDWESDWAECVPLALEAPALEPFEQICSWRRAVGSSAADLDVESATSAFRLGPDRIRRAADAARLASFHRDDGLAVDDLQWGARQQNGAGLRRLARRIVPEATWDDLVLDPEITRSVREVVSRVRHRAFVLGEWKLRRGGGRGDGITAMFAGPSGTGKTLAAEVIAGDLGVDLHTVDLATVVDKYIGETEKNLDRIFDEAEQVNTVLFFDEADALFGKRSEVKDARDRYANVEVAYLLQRMERFDGAAILATNLKLNIDEAFARRLDLVVEFEKPDATERRHLWSVIAGRDLPLADDVDLAFLGDSFDLAGGDIRNAVTTAAYLAADRGGRVEMTDCVRAVAREYRKLGRLCLPHEFGAWFEVLDAAVVEIDA
ncbi:MAG: ATP-binding protein [Ilumatobacter sp.]|nr:ATP-binding protein [Ilumatobacter sp.]